MTIYTTLLTFHPPLGSVVDVATYGGAPNTSITQVTATKNNEFRDITNAERQTGLIDYRKQFINNGNDSDWMGVVAWISENTPSPDDTFDICQAGTLSLLGATVLLGVATFESETAMLFPDDIYRAVRPGEWIYDIVNDPSMGNRRMVSTVASYSVTVATAFGGATAGSFSIGVCPATMFTFTAPTSKSTGFYIGDIGVGESVGMWKRRTSNPDATAYENNYAIIAWESE